MFCTKCGQQIDDGTIFCTRCGNNLQDAPQQPSAPMEAPVYPGYAQGYPAVQPKKSKKGLIIGLSATAAVLVIAAILLFVIILPGGGTAIAGKWYDQSGYGTVEFLNDGTYKYDVMGIPISGNYTYNAGSKTGQMTIDMLGVSQEIAFELEGELLNMQGAYYTRDAVEQQDLSDMMDDLDLSGFGDGSELDSLDMSDFNLDDYDLGDLSDYNVGDILN